MTKKFLQARFKKILDIVNIMKLRIDSKKIYLRRLRYSDAEDIYKNVKDKEIIRWTLNIPYPYPKNGAIKFIKQTHYRIKKKKGYAFGIIPKEDGKVAGVTELCKIDWKNKNATLGYWIGKNHWNKGITTEAVKLILNFAFNQLKLHKVSADLFENNIASKRVLEKSGFKLEGRFRETRVRYNKWQNELRYSILAKEYKRK